MELQGEIYTFGPLFCIGNRGQKIAEKGPKNRGKSLIFDSNFYTFHFIRKSGVFCRTLSPGVPKPILFSDESANTVLGGGRDCIYGGGCLSFFLTHICHLANFNTPHAGSLLFGKSAYVCQLIWKKGAFWNATRRRQSKNTTLAHLLQPPRGVFSFFTKKRVFWRFFLYKLLGRSLQFV